MAEWSGTDQSVAPQRRSLALCRCDTPQADGRMPATRALNSKTTARRDFLGLSASRLRPNATPEPCRLAVVCIVSLAQHRSHDLVSEQPNFSY